MCFGAFLVCFFPVTPRAAPPSWTSLTDIAQDEENQHLKLPVEKQKHSEGEAHQSNNNRFKQKKKDLLPFFKR